MIVCADIKVLFDVTPSFRKKVASVLDISTKDLPKSDQEFIQIVLSMMIPHFHICDPITQEVTDLSTFMATEDQVAYEECEIENTKSDDV